VEVNDRRQSTRARGDGGPLDRPDPMRLRGFVPLDELIAIQPSGSGDSRDDAPAAAPGSVRKRGGDSGGAAKIAPQVVPPAVLPDAFDDWERRISLFGELEG